jgi:hypothetical protein
MHIFEGRQQAVLLTEKQKEQLARPCYFIGCDLAQITDYSTFVLLERHGQDTKNYSFRVMDLFRWEHRTSFSEIVSDTVRWMNSPELSEDVSQLPTLAVDQTGIGLAVMDLFKNEKINGKMMPITITSGDTVNILPDSFRVPKRELCSVVAVLLETDRLEFTEKHPLTPLLKRKLENFKAKITTSGNDTYGAANDWRVGNNDDLVLGLALALWCAMNEQKTPIFYSF